MVFHGPIISVSWALKNEIRTGIDSHCRVIALQSLCNDYRFFHKFCCFFKVLRYIIDRNDAG